MYFHNGVNLFSYCFPSFSEFLFILLVMDTGNNAYFVGLRQYILIAKTAMVAYFTKTARVISSPRHRVENYYPLEGRDDECLKVRYFRTMH